MVEARVAPYGSWKSPITSDLIVAGTVGLGYIRSCSESLFWIELRPTEKGRQVLVRRTTDGRVDDLTPMPFNARTRAHEYGGCPYLVTPRAVYFSNFADQRLYVLEEDAPPRPITPEADIRYADCMWDAARERIVCVREDHTHPRDPLGVTTIVSLDPHGRQDARVLVEGSDFYSSPRLSPDGSRLAWLTWNHPNMPWDGTELWLAEMAGDGGLARPQRIAGGPDESIFQPEWSPDGILHFVSDRTDWWNLYRWRDGAIKPLCPMEAEFGVPTWVFGQSTYAFESARRLICAYSLKGVSRLAVLDTDTKKLEPISVPYTAIGDVHAQPGEVQFLGGSPTDAPAIVRTCIPSGRTEILRRSSTITVDPGYLSAPEAVEFPTEGGRTAHAFFCPPRNRDYMAPAGERPPLLVMIHGGPTSSASTALNLRTQYWTSRGVAVLDVNYGGSSGYGRQYRRRLNGQWGVVDVDDCVNGARYLVDKGLVDGNRLAITGGSAGGYTTLAALTFRDTFKAGASHFGVSDLEALVRDTHKFESRYLDRLIGPYPERKDLYVARSPIHFLDRLNSPIILFQGLEDKIVPPNQAQMIFDAARTRGLPVAYLPFEGEQHGFRRAENIKRALEAEFYFYARVFGYTPADAIEPVKIENLGSGPAESRGGRSLE
ncbi:MAG: S9 family peptidase [Candidatus Brocadiia bacterium]